MWFPGPGASPNVSDFTDALQACETDLHEQNPTAFTVEGVSGSFTGLFDTLSANLLLGTDGMRGERAAALSCLKSSGYTPSTGDIVTVDDQEWRVERVQGGPVKWEMTLIGVHQ